MGGAVCLAIRRAGRQSARIFHKSAASTPASAELFDGTSWVLKEWKKSEAQRVAPFGYGLVVVDFDSKWVGGIQSYDSFDQAYFHDTKAPEVIESVLALWRQGRIEGFIERSAPGRPVHPVAARSEEQMLAEINKNIAATKYGDITLRVSPPQGWEFTSYKEKASGWSAFVEDMARRKWLLSVADVAAWDEFSQNHELPFGLASSITAAGALDKQTRQVKRAPVRRRL